MTGARRFAAGAISNVRSRLASGLLLVCTLPGAAMAQLPLGDEGIECLERWREMVNGVELRLDALNRLVVPAYLIAIENRTYPVSQEPPPSRPYAAWRFLHAPRGIWQLPATLSYSSYGCSAATDPARLVQFASEFLASEVFRELSERAQRFGAEYRAADASCAGRQVWAEECMWTRLPRDFTAGHRIWLPMQAKAIELARRWKVGVASGQAREQSPSGICSGSGDSLRCTVRVRPDVDSVCYGRGCVRFLTGVDTLNFRSERRDGAVGSLSDAVQARVRADRVLRAATESEGSSVFDQLSQSFAGLLDNWRDPEVVDAFTVSVTEALVEELLLGSTEAADPTRISGNARSSVSLPAGLVAASMLLATGDADDNVQGAANNVVQSEVRDRVTNLLSEKACASTGDDAAVWQSTCWTHFLLGGTGPRAVYDHLSRIQGEAWTFVERALDDLLRPSALSPEP